MKKTLLSIILLIPICSFSQNRFIGLYGSSGNDFANAVVESKDKGFMIGGGTLSAGTGTCDMYFVKTDSLGELEWSLCYGDTQYEYCSDIIVLADSGYVAAGVTRSFGDSVYHHLLKFDQNGDILWSKAIYNQLSGGMSIEPTTDGGFVCAGTVISDSSSYMAFLGKFNSNGDTLWTRQYGGVYSDYGNHAIETSDGGYIMAANGYGFGPSNRDVYVIKTDAQGDAEWSRWYGSLEIEIPKQIIEVENKSYVIVGEYSSFSYDEGFAMKIDSLGNTIWQYEIGENNYDGLSSVVLDNAGNYVMSGWLDNQANTDVSLFTLALNPSGSPVWHTGSSYGDSKECTEEIILASDGDLVTIGHADDYAWGGSDFYLVKSDSVGDPGCNTITPVYNITNLGFQEGPMTGMLQFSGAYIVDSLAKVFPLTTNDSLLCDTISSAISHLDYTEEKLEVYPNPTNGTFTIKGSNGPTEILDLYGRVILITNSKQVDMSSQPNGIYFAISDKRRVKLMKQ